MGAALRMLQIVRWAMLVSIILYVFVAEQVAKTGPPNPVILYALTGLAVSIVAAVVFVRRTWAQKAESALVGQPGDPAAINRWRAGYLVTYALCESVAVYGLVLRFVGFGFTQAAAFYIAGFVLLLFYVPRAPSNAIG